jgi:hypothetical protein
MGCSISPSEEVLNIPRNTTELLVCPCIESHFCNKERLEFISKDLKEVFVKLKKAQDFLCNKTFLSSEKLASLSGEIPNRLNHLCESHEELRFSGSSFGLEKSIDEASSSIKDISGHIDNILGLALGPP